MKRRSESHKSNERAKEISFLYDGMGKRIRKFAEAIGTADGFDCGWLVRADLLHNFIIW
ncbi:MAG: hypothetical protein JST20_10485 [Bacteroidetes bacterium]|nr:hypothetical protein [Bacteroidota bacterium]